MFQPHGIKSEVTLFLIVIVLLGRSHAVVRRIEHSSLDRSCHCPTHAHAASNQLRWGGGGIGVRIELTLVFVRWDAQLHATLLL